MHEEDEDEQENGEAHPPQHKKASLLPGCFPSLDVTRDYISVKDFHKFFPNAIPENEGEKEGEEGEGYDRNRIPEIPPELDISDLKPVTYNDFITQTIQDSIVHHRYHHYYYI